MTPNTRLCPCPHCAGLVDIAAQRCPHCEETLVDAAGSKLGAAAILWATLALTACPTEDIYGAPDTVSGDPPTTMDKTTGKPTEATDGASTTAPTSGTTGTTEATGSSGATEATGTSGGAS